VLQPFYMEKVNLHDWLRKVTSNEETRAKALKMHMEGDAHFRRVYEIEGEGDAMTMTWRFMVATGRKP
jgi:hypothetical protein